MSNTIQFLHTHGCKLATYSVGTELLLSGAGTAAHCSPGLPHRHPHLHGHLKPLEVGFAPSQLQTYQDEQSKMLVICHLMVGTVLTEISWSPMHTSCWSDPYLEGHLARLLTQLATVSCQLMNDLTCSDNWTDCSSYSKTNGWSVSRMLSDFIGT